MSTRTERNHMVRTQIEARGIWNPRILAAMREVPREAFVPPRVREFAYEDSALPIDEGQTISQPYIVALMADAAELAATNRVLEIGTGSGYAAAVLSRIAEEVVTVERHARLAETAQARFAELGYDNIRVHVADGSVGWPETAPYDVISSTAAGPRVPPALFDQLAIGGRLVMPVGDRQSQALMFFRRIPSGFEERSLGDVRFVPLVGADAWPDEPSAADTQPGWRRSQTARARRPPELPEQIREAGHAFSDVDHFDVEGFVDRAGSSRVVLLGESTHGTAEFCELRARITQALIERAGFTAVALEADWPDGAELDRRARRFDERTAEPDPEAFRRFPVWMWQNREFERFVERLRGHHEGRPMPERVGLYGLDLYSMYRSMQQVIEYLEGIDPSFADTARRRYGCLSPWQSDPTAYGLATLSERYRACEDDVVAVLNDLLKSDLAERSRSDHDGFFDAVQNAHLVADAEAHHRAIYRGSRASWNLRDRHMFETLQRLLERGGPDAKVVVWAHNSHVGDARATEMGARGEWNLGQLCRERFGSDAYLVGFGTDHGTVMAAEAWDGPHAVRSVRPSHAESYERIFHQSEAPGLALPLRSSPLRRPLSHPRLERAIGVIYRPASELESHSFHAALPVQFDEYVWVDETRAVAAPAAQPAEGLPETYPFGV